MTKKENPGYHINEIPRGVYGEFSKIEEEFAEVQDAWEQYSGIMALVEMSDLIGAMEGYYGDAKVAECITQAEGILCAISDYHFDLHEFIIAAFEKMKATPDDASAIVHFLALLEMWLNSCEMDFEDLMIMNKITKRAFKAGRRVPNT